MRTARGISSNCANCPMHILLDARAATNPQSDLARYCRGVTEGLIPLLAPDEHLTVIFARHADLPNVSREHCRLRRAHHNLNPLAGQHEIARIVRRARPDIVWSPTPKFLPPAGNAASPAAEAGPTPGRTAQAASATFSTASGRPDRRRSHRLSPACAGSAASGPCGHRRPAAFGTAVLSVPGGRGRGAAGGSGIAADFMNALRSAARGVLSIKNRLHFP